MNPPRGEKGLPLWATSWVGADGKEYGGQVEAASFQEAQEIAKPGHRVLGQLMLQVDVDTTTVGSA